MCVWRLNEYSKNSQSQIFFSSEIGNYFFQIGEKSPLNTIEKGAEFPPLRTPKKFPAAFIAYITQIPQWYLALTACQDNRIFGHILCFLGDRYTIFCFDNPIKWRLESSKEKKRQKIEFLVMFCVFSEIGIQYFDSIIIHLGLLINRSVANPKIEALL